MWGLEDKLTMQNSKLATIAVRLFKSVQVSRLSCPCSLFTFTCSMHALFAQFIFFSSSKMFSVIGNLLKENLNQLSVDTDQYFDCDLKYGPSVVANLNSQEKSNNQVT